MKKLLMVCLVFAIFVSMGCGNKPESEKDSTSAGAGTAKMVYLADPVDRTKFENIEDGKYPFIYKDIEYRFTSKKNHEAFKKDPEKYLPKPK